MAHYDLIDFVAVLMGYAVDCQIKRLMSDFGDGRD
jgi:hypothetical protein